MKDYKEKLQSPKWQKKRLEILERDKFTCQKCNEEGVQLHVHHRFYRHKTDPWDYPDYALITLCKFCHDDEANAISHATSIKEILLTNFFGDELASIDYDLSYYLPQCCKMFFKLSDLVDAALYMLQSKAGQRAMIKFRIKGRRKHCKERQLKLAPAT